MTSAKPISGRPREHVFHFGRRNTRADCSGMRRARDDIEFGRMMNRIRVGIGCAAFLQPLIGWTPRRTVGFRRFGGDMGWLAGVGALMGVSWAVSGAEFWTGGANICLRPARFRSGGRSSPVEPGQALHVVGEIGEADLGGGPGALPLIPNTYRTRLRLPARPQNKTAIRPRRNRRLVAFPASVARSAG